MGSKLDAPCAIFSLDGGCCNWGERFNPPPPSPNLSPSQALLSNTVLLRFQTIATKCVSCTRDTRSVEARLFEIFYASHFESILGMAGVTISFVTHSEISLCKLWDFGGGFSDKVSAVLIKFTTGDFANIQKVSANSCGIWKSSFLRGFYRAWYFLIRDRRNCSPRIRLNYCWRFYN